MLVLQQAWVVVALVEVLKHSRKDLGFFVGYGYPLTLRIEVLVPADARKERRLAKDLLVRRKQSSFSAHGKSDNGRAESLLDRHALFDRPLQFRQLLWITSNGVRLLHPRRLVDSVLGPERALAEHGGDGGMSEMVGTSRKLLAR